MKGRGFSRLTAVQRQRNERLIEENLLDPAAVLAWSFHHIRSFLTHPHGPHFPSRCAFIASRNGPVSCVPSRSASSTAIGPIVTHRPPLKQHEAWVITLAVVQHDPRPENPGSITTPFSSLFSSPPVINRSVAVPSHTYTFFTSCRRCATPSHAGPRGALAISEPVLVSCV